MQYLTAVCDGALGSKRLGLGTQDSEEWLRCRRSYVDGQAQGG